jgi:hypothetical protein
MDHVHVRQRLQAFAGRLRRSEGPAGEKNAQLERAAAATRKTSAGLRAMNTLGAGRR